MTKNDKNYNKHKNYKKNWFNSIVFQKTYK